MQMSERWKFKSYEVAILKINNRLFIDMPFCQHVPVEVFPQDFAWGAATAAYQIEGKYAQTEIPYLVLYNFSRRFHEQKHVK